MSIEKKTTGTGFTKRRHVEISGPFEEEEVQAIKASIDNYEDPFDMIERVCKAKLREDGWPDSRRVVVWLTDGSWREAPDGWDTKPNPGDKSIGGLWSRVGEGRQIPEDSPVGYAWRMVELLFYYRGAVDRSDVERASHMALTLGALWREADMKERMEPFALHSRNMKKATKKPRLNDIKEVLVATLNCIGWDAGVDGVWDHIMNQAERGFYPFDIIVLPDWVEEQDKSIQREICWNPRRGGEEKRANESAVSQRIRRLKKLKRDGKI